MRGTSRVLLGLLICGLVLLLVIYGLYSSGLRAQDKDRSGPTVHQIETKPTKPATEGARENMEIKAERTPPQRQMNEPGDDFYKPIVENSLFRPLGWRKPDRESEYTLLGTLIESNNQRAKAFLIERRSNQYYPVSVGEKLGDVTVESIKPYEVSLGKNGKTVTLRANSNRFLDTSTTSDKGRERFNEGSEHVSSEKKTQEGKPESRGNRGWDEDRMRKMAERYRNASPEERKRMKEEFSRRGGERRRSGESERREGRGRGGNSDGDTDTGRRQD
jgi:hypothetical protein